MDAVFEFRAKLHEWSANPVMALVTLPVDLAEDIRDMGLSRRGFGSVRVRVRTGGSEWRTSLFPDKESGSYVLPVKRAVRDAERLDIGDAVDFEIDIAPE